mgnify:FL=1
MTKRFLRLLVAGGLVFLIVEATTFGWNIFKPATIIASKDRQLPARLKGHVYKLSLEIGNRNIFNYSHLEQAAEYITSQLESYGYDVQFHKYFINNKETKNIIVTKVGEKKPGEIIVVGAHYDSYFNPGADDNASGVSGLLELSRFFKNQISDRTLRFVFFANEEPPFFKTEYMGSRVYARQAKKSKEDIKAVIVFDSIGFYSNRIFSQRYLPLTGIFFPNKANFISVISNFRNRQFVAVITKSFKKNSKFPIESVAFDFIPAVDFSDHRSFWKEGYPAVMISDTAFLRHGNYHQNTDTWDKLNYEYFASVIEGFSSVIIDLSSKSKGDGSGLF